MTQKSDFYLIGFRLVTPDHKGPQTLKFLSVVMDSFNLISSTRQLLFSLKFKVFCRASNQTYTISAFRQTRCWFWFCSGAQFTWNQSGRMLLGITQAELRLRTFFCQCKRTGRFTIRFGNWTRHGALLVWNPKMWFPLCDIWGCLQTNPQRSGENSQIHRLFEILIQFSDKC